MFDRTGLDIAQGMCLYNFSDSITNTLWIVEVGLAPIVFGISLMSS